VTVPNLEKRRVEGIYQPDKQDTFRMDREGPVKVSTGPQWSADSIHYFLETLRKPDYFQEKINIREKDLVTVDPDGTKSFFFQGPLTVIYGDPMKGVPYCSSDITITGSSRIIIEA